RLTAITGANPDALLYVRGDKAINYGRVLEVMSLVSTAGFRKVSLIAEAPKGTAAKSSSGAAPSERSRTVRRGRGLTRFHSDERGGRRNPTDARARSSRGDAGRYRP